MNSKLAVPEKVESKFNVSEKSGKKRVNFQEKPIVIKSNQSVSRNPPVKPSKVNMKSILKGDIEENETNKGEEE